MERSALGRCIFVFVVVAATVPLTGQSSFGETTECRISPGPPAPQGKHWYYRVDRTYNRHCWYMEAAGIQIRSHRNVATSNPSQVASERIPASFPTNTDAATPLQLATADLLLTETRDPSVDERAMDFTARWIDLPKSVDLDEREFAQSYATEDSTPDFKQPMVSTWFVASASNRELLPRSASAINFWSIFFAGALSIIIFGAVLKLTRRLYNSAASIWTPNEPADCPETNLSELMRALRRIDELYKSPMSLSQLPRRPLGRRSSGSDVRLIGGNYGVEATLSRMERFPQES
jgi:hypothetical protein